MIDVAFTPAEGRVAGVAVVIDVLRATTTATQALASGFSRVLCVDSLERALRMQARGRLLAGEQRDGLAGVAVLDLAGEQHGKKPPGFDLGNSPADVARDPADVADVAREPADVALDPADVGRDRAEELVLATTNGAPTIVEAARRAPLVLLACLLNFDAVRAELAGVEDVQIVCSGTYGEIALEDVYVAGRLCAELSGARTDAALAAEAVARAYPSAYDVLAASANAKALVAAGLGEDIEFCARESTLGIVPRVERTRPGLAVVVREMTVAREKVDGAGNVESVVAPAGAGPERATEPQPTT